MDVPGLRRHPKFRKRLRRAVGRWGGGAVGPPARIGITGTPLPSAAAGGTERWDRAVGPPARIGIAGTPLPSAAAKAGKIL